MPLNNVFTSLAFVAVGAIAFYPVYMLAVFCLDYTCGGRVLWQSLVYESWSHTVGLLRSDWLLALPVGAVVCGPLLLPELLRARGAGNTAVALVSAAVIAVLVLASRLLGFEGTQLIPVGFVTVVLACGCHLAFRYRRAN
jgi:hypothetical protein